MLTEAQLRGVLQLPVRPFQETILFDGSRYYDLTNFEPIDIFSVVGNFNGNPTYAFTEGIDFVLTSGVIDFSQGVSIPQLGSSFKVDYSYSALGVDAVSTSMFIASTTVYQALSSKFPAGEISAAGVAYDDLATMGALMVAAREACAAMAASEIWNAVKYRRGSIQVDETAKTKNWADLAVSWEEKYNKYLGLIRGGRPSAIRTITANAYDLVFVSDGLVGAVGEFRSLYSEYGGL